MKVRFYIEKRKDEAGNPMVRERPVVMSVSFNGNRVMIGTGVKVDMHNWDSEHQKVKEIAHGFEAINDWLGTLKDTADKTIFALQNANEGINADGFRNLFEELKPTRSSGFFDVFYRFLEEGSTRWSRPTYQKVRTVYKHIREFEDVSGFRVTFGSINEEFLGKFSAFYKEKGNSSTTTVKAVNILVWFLNWATDNRYNVYREYRGFYKKMGTTRSPGTRLFLHWDELMKIWEYHPEKRKAEQAKDLFCFMCFSGLRYSELKRLKKEDVLKEEIVIRKPGTKLRRLPLNKYTKEILSRYENKYYLDNAAFPPMSIVTLNKYLRMIGEERGLFRIVNSTGDNSETPIFKNITAGLAINTFIGNALKLNIPIEIISRYTGVQKDRRIQQIKADLGKEEMNIFDRK